MTVEQWAALKAIFSALDGMNTEDARGILIFAGNAILFSATVPPAFDEEDILSLVEHGQLG